MIGRSKMENTRQSMDFFEHQDRAKSNSRRFLLLYIIAVVLICIAVAAFAGVAMWFVSDPKLSDSLRMNSVMIAAGASALITGLLIVGGSAHRIAELRRGGSSIARSLGGQHIDPSTRDPNERRLMNVVEEMAIASGVPVPPVFIMPGERGINAFAAGYSPGDAVIGVTRGCVEGLERDELQGVMAHEFSHILNGDMRLNIRMIGLLNGIVLISLVGHIILEAAPRTARGKNGIWAFLSMLAVALVLMMIGWIGSLSARVIQSAVCRQREFLADASAVQFTRNPEGIANALRRIGAKSRSTRIKHPRAQEASHMFFGQAIAGTSLLRATLASHPPLPERIKRIYPAWDGTMLEPLIDDTIKSPPKEMTPRERMSRVMPGVAGIETAILPMLALAGAMTPEHIEYARELILAIPKQLKDAARDISSGRAVVYALLLDRNSQEIRSAQIGAIERDDRAIASVVRSIADQAIGLDRGHRLALLDMTLGSLAHLSDRQHKSFRATVDALIKMDKSVDLFEWVTMGVLTRHLDERFGLAKPSVTQYYAFGQLGNELSVLLSALAHAGAQDEHAAAEAFMLGEVSLGDVEVRLLPKKESGLDRLDQSLRTLASCSGKLKRELLRASAVVVCADKKVTTSEAELLRAVGDALGVPTPPLLPGQRLVDDGSGPG
jgi:Zn-dependent protease with chaperone function